MNKNRKKKLVHFSPSSTMETNALHLMMFVFGDSFRQYGIELGVTKGLSFLLLVYDLPNIDLSTLKLYITDFSGKHRVYKLMVKDDVASEFIEISKSSH